MINIIQLSLLKIIKSNIELLISSEIDQSLDTKLVNNLAELHSNLTEYFKKIEVKDASQIL